MPMLHMTKLELRLRAIQWAKATLGAPPPELGPQKASSENELNELTETELAAMKRIWPQFPLKFKLEKHSGQ